MAYAIIKNPGRSGFLIDDGSGSSVRYATKREAELTIARWERQEAENAVYAAERAERLNEDRRAACYARAEKRAWLADQFAFSF